MFFPTYKRATMNRTICTQPRSTPEAHFRAGGRRRYNAERQDRAELRLLPLAFRLAELGQLINILRSRGRAKMPRLPISALAKAMGVNRSTVWRDVQRLGHWNYCWEYSGVTNMVKVRLDGLGSFTYSF